MNEITKQGNTETDVALAGQAERRVMRFDELALGARFKYANSQAKNPQIWIKISGDGCGVIAEYDATLIAHKNWFGQSVCSAKESICEDLLVEFVA